MRSSFLLLFLAATLCAVEEIRANVSLQGENLTPSFRNGRRLFAVGPNENKTSQMINGKELSDAGAQGTVSQAGSFGPLVAASSAAYFLLSQFVAFKHEGINAHRRELSANTPRSVSTKHPFLTRPPIDLPDKLTGELKKKAQEWRDLMEKAKERGNHLEDTAFDILYHKANLLTDDPNAKDPHIIPLRTASLDMVDIMKKVLKAKKLLEEMAEFDIIAKIIADEIAAMLDFMRFARRVTTRIIVEKTVIAKENIAAARANLQDKDLVEAMNKLIKTRTDLYNQIRHELSAKGEAVETWLEDAGYHYYWRVNPYYEHDKIIVREKREVDAAEESFHSSPPRAVLTKTVEKLAEEAKKLVELNTQESEIDKAREMANEAIKYTKESYSHTIRICQLVQKPLEEINPKAGDLLQGAGRNLRNVYAAINGVDELLVILEDDLPNVHRALALA